MGATKMENDIVKLSFEDALKELEALKVKMESGNIPLDDALTLFERGNALKAHCEGILANAKMKVEKIIDNKDGSVDVAAF
jgi:exodeoxyribonuclease VII small subunit